MADYAPNYTPRYRLHYRTAGANHTLTVRVARAAAAGWEAGVTSKLTAFFEALGPVMYSDWEVISAESAQVDSDVFLPTTAPTAVGTFGVLEATSAKAKAISFVGRAADGQKMRFFVYGIGFTPYSYAGTDFRILSSEDTNVEAAITALDELAPAFVASSGVAGDWYQYVNLKYNDYWTSRVRTGS